jgi:cell division septum initiation protein DivIVA
VEETVPYSNERTHYEMQDLWGDRYDWGFMDYIDHYNPLKDDSVAPLQGPAGSTAPSYTGSISTDPSIWDRTMATIAGAAEMPFPANDAVVTDDNFIDLVHSQLPRLTEQGSADSLNILMDKMAGGMNTEVDYAPGSSGAIDQIVANTILQQQAVQPAAYSPPVNVPSIFKPKPAPVASVYAAPGGKPELTISQQAQAKQDSILAQAKAKSAAITAQAQAKQKSITQQAQKQVYQKQYEQLKKAGAPVRRSGNRYGFGF